MKRKNGLVFLSLALVLLAGCATLNPTPTTYGPFVNTGGYSETKIQDNVFKVTFRGNAYISSGQAENFALLRSAEVTIENGYKYFVIVENKSKIETSTYSAPIQSIPNYSTGGVMVYGGGQTTSHKPSENITIQCFKEKPENSPTMIYDAQQVRDNIKTQYKIK